MAIQGMAVEIPKAMYWSRYWNNLETGDVLFMTDDFVAVNLCADLVDMYWNDADAICDEPERYPVELVAAAQETLETLNVLLAEVSA